MLKRIILSLFLFFTAVYSDIPESILYLHPRPGSTFVNQNTPLILRLREGCQDEPHFMVSDDQGVTLQGQRKLSDDGRTTLFCFDSPLNSDQRINVCLDLGANGSFKYNFKTSRQGAAVRSSSSKKINSTAPAIQTVGSPTIMSNGVAVPSDFPQVNIFVNNHPSEGKYFFNNEWGASPYMIMLENSGAPYFYMKTSHSQRDFKVQRNGLLTARFVPSIDGIRGGAFLAYDSTYAVVDTFLTAPGYEVDEHEFVVLENGHYFLIALEYQIMDMSQIVNGAEEKAEVGFTHLQEYDSGGNLILHFDSREKLDILDIVFADPREPNFRFPHMNAIDIDDDGHILLSCRHLSTVFKIHRQTGEIIWQLGGAHSDFQFVNDSFDGFECQHAFRRTGPDQYLLFDNGNLHLPPVSRAVEYQLDLEAMTATLIWEYRQESDATYSRFMGNTQRLDNGNTLINWAINERPKATEVKEDGTKVFEMNFVDQHPCYRTHKFNWNVPAIKPYLLVEHQGDHLVLIFNKFGDPDVDHYRIYQGTSGDDIVFQDTSALPLKHIYDVENYQTYYFKVAAVNSNMERSQFSDIVSCTVNLVEPGQNLIQNGDFSKGDTYWELIETDEADVKASVEEGVYHMDIQNLGTEIWHIQFRQNGLAMLEGHDYEFEFDAWASTSMIIDARIEKETEPWINYGKIGSSSIRRSKKHFKYNFTVEDLSDYHARIVFNSNSVVGDLYIDNVSLILLEASEPPETNQTVYKTFRIIENYPNPFNNETNIRFELPTQSQVSWTLYDIRGRHVLTEKVGIFSAGRCNITLQMNTLSSGVYLCRMNARSVNHNFIYSDVRKMVYLQ
ncbi:aryl-sulfate sulfotransferase [bacterium]